MRLRPPAGDICPGGTLAMWSTAPFGCCTAEGGCLPWALACDIGPETRAADVAVPASCVAVLPGAGTMR